MQEKLDFCDATLLEAAQRDNDPVLREFLRLLALCHTVMVEEKGGGLAMVDDVLRVGSNWSKALRPWRLPPSLRKALLCGEQRVREPLYIWVCCKGNKWEQDPSLSGMMQAGISSQCSCGHAGTNWSQCLLH